MFWKRSTARPTNGSAPADAALFDPALWDQLALYARQHMPQALATRTAAEIGLPQTAGSALLREYLRFVYLTGITREPLAPSKAVAAMWQAHIATGSHYFEDFGPGVIDIALHGALGRPKPSHDPAFQRTLDLYFIQFGENPRGAIWSMPQAEALPGRPPGHWLDRVHTSIGTGIGRVGLAARGVMGIQTASRAPEAEATPVAPPTQTLLDRLQAEATDRRLPLLAQSRLDLGEAEAVRLTVEYLRFLYLLQSCPAPIVPPEMIRLLWSKHVLETPDYMERFCPEALQSTLLPSQIEAGPDPATAAAHTRAEYRRVFGTSPPPDIWPGPAEFAAIRKANLRSLAALGVIGLSIVAIVIVPHGLMAIFAMFVCCLALLYMFGALMSSRGALLHPGKSRRREVRSLAQWDGVG